MKFSILYIGRYRFSRFSRNIYIIILFARQKHILTKNVYALLCTYELRQVNRNNRVILSCDDRGTVCVLRDILMNTINLIYSSGKKMSRQYRRIFIRKLPIDYHQIRAYYDDRAIHQYRTLIFYHYSSKQPPVINVVNYSKTHSLAPSQGVRSIICV